jgi:hypothetical protein
MPVSRKFIAGLLASLGIGADKRAQVDHALATIDAQEGDDNHEASLEEQILGKLTALEHRLDAQDAAISALGGRTADAFTIDGDDPNDDGETEDEKRRKKDKEEEDEEAEAMGDTLIEAEGPGMTIQMGKVWTGDSASVDPYQAVKSLGEILAPGLTLPSKDELKGKQGKLMGAYMRRALNTAATRDSAGREAVATFLMGRKVDDLKGTDLIGVFRGAGNLVRARNNTMLRIVAGGSLTTDRSHVTAEKERQERVAALQR